MQPLANALVALAQHQQMANGMTHIGRLTSVRFAGENDLLRFLVVQHVLVGRIGDGQNVRCVLRARLAHVLVVVLQRSIIV